MKTCPKCGQAAAIWSRDLATGLCRKCAAAQKKAKAESLLTPAERAEQQRFEERFNAQLEEESRQRKAAQEQELRLHLGSRLEQLQQDHRARTAAINALDNVEQHVREKLLETAEQLYVDEALKKSVSERPGQTNGRLWLIALLSGTLGGLLGGVAVWSLSSSGRSESVGALGLPGSSWLLTTYHGKDPFGKGSILEFNEDGSLAQKQILPSGEVRWGEIGKYTLVGRDEITITLSPGASPSRLSSGRFTVFLAANNLVLEKGVNSDRVFLHRLQHPSDETARERAQADARHQEMRHQEIMSVLRQIAARK